MNFIESPNSISTVPGKKADAFYVPKEVRVALICRGVFGFMGNLAGTTGLKYIPLAKATVLFYTNPIFIGILAHILLKDRLTSIDIGGIAATFIGVYIFTMDPFGIHDSSQDFEINSREWWNDIIGSTLAVVQAILNAGAMISIRMVGNRVHYMMLGLMWGLINALFSLMLMLLSGQGSHTTEYGYNEIKYVSLSCLGTTVFQVFTTLAFLKERPARVAPIGALQLIINFIFDFFILNSGQPPKYNQIIGGLVIFCSNVSVSVLKCRKLIK